LSQHLFIGPYISSDRNLETGAANGSYPGFSRP